MNHVSGNLCSALLLPKRFRITFGEAFSLAQVCYRVKLNCAVIKTFQMSPGVLHRLRLAVEVSEISESILNQNTLSRCFLLPKIPHTKFGTWMGFVFFNSGLLQCELQSAETSPVIIAETEVPFRYVCDGGSCVSSHLRKGTHECLG